MGVACRGICSIGLRFVMVVAGYFFFFLRSRRFFMISSQDERYLYVLSSS